MKATLLLAQRLQITDDAFAELRMWRVPKPVFGSSHDLKYALAYVVNGVCVLRYDNEAGKGDHRHIGRVESPYNFTTPRQLLSDFWNDVDEWRLE
jgi:allantoicase